MARPVSPYPAVPSLFSAATILRRSVRESLKEQGERERERERKSKHETTNPLFPLTTRVRVPKSACVLVNVVLCAFGQGWGKETNKM